MSENTKIEWCDHSWSPWRGCTKVSAGCANCYAETLSKRNPAVLGQWGKGKPRVLAKNWSDPVKWNRRYSHSIYFEPRLPAYRATVFPSLCDWLDDEVPIEWLARFLKLIHDTPNLTWLLLTKRPENWESRISGAVSNLLQSGGNPAAVWAGRWLKHGGQYSPANVWIGTSVEDQTNADWRIPELLKIPAVGRFLSLEPLLGPVDAQMAFENFQALNPDLSRRSPPVSWAIIGGESGHGARPCNVEWIRSLVAQGKHAGVATFVKQLGADPYSERIAPESAPLEIKRLNHPKGGDPAEWPADLRVRELPEGLR